MHELLVIIPSTGGHASYSISCGRGDTVVDIVQATSGGGYAVFRDSSMVYVTQDYDELTCWIMEDLGLKPGLTCWIMEDLGLKHGNHTQKDTSK